MIKRTVMLTSFPAKFAAALIAATYAQAQQLIDCDFATNPANGPLIPNTKETCESNRGLATWVFF